MSEEQTEADKTRESDEALPDDLNMEGEEEEEEGEEEVSLCGVRCVMYKCG